MMDRMIIPVDLSVERHYRIYVNVENGAGSKEVHKAVLKYVQTNGLDDTDLDLELPEIEESDINGIVPDWDGVWTSDEGGI